MHLSLKLKSPVSSSLEAPETATSYSQSPVNLTSYQRRISFFLQNEEHHPPQTSLQQFPNPLQFSLFPIRFIIFFTIITAVLYIVQHDRCLLLHGTHFQVLATVLLLSDS